MDTEEAIKILMDDKHKTIAKQLHDIIFPQGGNYLWGATAGPSRATTRQAIMKILGKTLPKSKCGYNFVMDEMERALEVDMNQCTAARESELMDKLKGRK